MDRAEFERLAASADRVHLDTTTGATVVAHVFGEATMPSVVLLHGGAGSWNHWARTIPALRARFRVVALDLPGCGDSTLPDGIAAGAVLDLGGLDALATAVADAIDQVVPVPQRLGLVGFSFGGIVGVRAIAARSARRVVLVALIGSGGLGVSTGQAPPALRAVPRDAGWDERSAAHRHNLGALMLAGEGAADDLATVLHEVNVSRNRFRMGELPESPALVEVLGGISAPLVWITGERDAFAAGQHHRRREVVRGARPDAEFVDVPDAGHWAAYERPDVVNPLLVERLTEAFARTSRSER